MQKVALIFAVVQTFEQLVQARCRIQSDACVMTRRNFFSPHLHGVV
jgi:hypothetical protein